MWEPVMFDIEIRGAISIAAQIALLSLGASALPLIVRSEGTNAFVWAVAAHEAATFARLAQHETLGKGGAAALAQSRATC